ncbi:MAG: hypothetical protein MUF31_00340 [Akkermansiaceae bacterium]|jgi:hypothetical protein|nr:hypothetical protein [Akkermansiaceae bacterium]
MKKPGLENTGWWLLLGLAAVGWLVLAASMKGRGVLKHEVNLFHLKGSPYGMSLAYAMRGPMDLYWHRGQVEDHGHHEEEGEGEAGEPESADAEAIDHANVEQAVLERMVKMRQEAEAEEAAEAAEAQAGGGDEMPPPKHLREAMLRRIEGMLKAYHTRTHHMGDTPLMKAWRMNEAEKRMKLSYDMDPANLVCYGSYFFFLSESMARLEGSGEKEAIERGQVKALNLALKTAQYCRSRQDEPQAMITGAAACHDAITVLLIRKSEDKQLLSDLYRLFGEMLNRYLTLRTELQSNGGWEGYSSYRQKEMEDAFSFLRVSHQADRKAIEKHFGLESVGE